MTESDLLDQLSALDERAISQVHDRYFEQVYRYARYRLGNPDRAEDVAAETFLRLLEAIQRKRGPRRSLKGWLMRTTANIVNDAFRDHYRHPQEPLDGPLKARGTAPEAVSDRTQEKEDLRRALAALTVEQQHVLSLRFGAELSLRETADIMNRSVNAVKSLQFRALSALRQQLAGIES